MPKKYSRREAIKYSAKIGTGAAIWGTAGNFIGRAYETGRDLYKEKIEPQLEKVEKLSEAGEKNFRKTQEAISRSINYWKNGKLEPLKDYKESNEEIKQPKNISRRSFLKKILQLGHENPVAAGTLTGVAYGASKKTIGGAGDYRKNMRIAGLRESNEELQEKIRGLEEKVMKIEKETSKPEQIFDYSIVLIGFFGLIVSILKINHYFSLTGLSIINSIPREIKIITLILMIISVILVITGIKKIHKHKEN